LAIEHLKYFGFGAWKNVLANTLGHSQQQKCHKTMQQYKQQQQLKCNQK